jgi:DNA-binding phage protein
MTINTTPFDASEYLDSEDMIAEYLSAVMEEEDQDVLLLALADKKIPLTLKVPNVETRTAMAEADEIARTHRTRFDSATELFEDLEKNSRK